MPQPIKGKNFSKYGKTARTEIEGRSTLRPLFHGRGVTFHVCPMVKLMFRKAESKYLPKRRSQQRKAKLKNAYVKRAHRKRTTETRACRMNIHTYTKLKLILSPLGLSVPSMKIGCISCRFRLVLLPQHCLTLQILMSSIVGLAELKCSATGIPGDQLRMLRRCSLKRSRRCLVSPMYMLVQRRQVMQYPTFSV